MAPDFNIQYYKCVLVLLLLICVQTVSAQKEEDALRFQLAFGLNHAFENGFPQPDANLLTDIQAHAINFPTINVGAQYMFTNRWGAKLDLGFNRLANAKDVPDFKINYTRINAQVAYDYSYLINLFPEEVSFVAHAGPGYTKAKPLGTLKGNDQNYLNAMIGTEVLYELSRNAKVFADLAFVYGFSNPDDYTAPETGLGAFNGSIFTFTVGVSLSLSGCYFCN
ncbi:outer membrane beta-barrel protein [Formosa sp. S-31]|uniref:outer membrane beta-barrel protein n=1 Tax=Formosa sp. S-31 TaxID=2790949 RepID=UPI003EBBBEAB